MGHTAPITKQQLVSARVDFKNEKFNILIEQKGLKLTHHFAVKCSCIREVSGSALPNCDICDGVGFTFHGEHILKGVIQAINFNPKIQQYSEINLGTAMLTTRYTDRLGWYDKIVIDDGETMFSENVFPIIRGTGLAQKCSGLLTYAPIDYLQPLGSNVTMRAFLYVNTTTQTELTYLTDYTFSGREMILSNTLRDALIASEQDKYYIGVRYKHKPEYIVMDIQKNIRNTLVMGVGDVEELKHLPIHCTIKKTHYLLNGQGITGG